MESTSSTQTTHGAIQGTTGATPSGSQAGTDAINVLLQDHIAIKSLLDRLNSVTNPNDRLQTLEELKELLTIHNATEENFVYAALAKVAGKQEQSETLYHETAEADMLVFELDTALKTNDINGFIANAKKLRDAVLAHIDEEERKAFPELQQNAKPEQTQMLNRSVQMFRSSLHFHKG